MTQFKTWFEIAEKHGVKMPEVMTLATVDAQNTPDARIVLLKELNAQGLVFFTNYHSPKGVQLSVNPQAACVFWWPELERQVRVRGIIFKLSALQSDQYFAKRPRGSQLGALCSAQSETLEDREEMEKTYAELEKYYEGKKIPRPEHWGGYCLSPKHFEFWQGRDNRLHDRFAYDLQSAGQWKIERLAP